MKTYCSHCRRETFGSHFALNGRKQGIDVCGNDMPSSSARWKEECHTFTAGRRAGLREALKLAKASMSHAYGLDEFNRAIRVALKVKS